MDNSRSRKPEQADRLLERGADRLARLTLPSENLLLKMRDSPLLFLDGMECPLEASHPAGQAGLLFFELDLIPLDLAPSASVLSGRTDRAQHPAARSTHLRSPPAEFAAAILVDGTRP
jgi:hypothetical protein